MQIVVPEEFKFLYKTDRKNPVVKIPDPVLSQQAVEIAKVNSKVQKLADEMIQIMHRAHGVGLAAPQIGISKRIIVIAPADVRPMALINPVIVKAEGEQIGQEGCLSIPALYGDVKRYAYIEVEALDRKGREITLELEGMPARIVQHEVDHLDGILFTDKVDPATLHWELPVGAE